MRNRISAKAASSSLTSNRRSKTAAWRHALVVARMTLRPEQLRVIEGRLILPHPLVGERLEERHHRADLRRGQPDGADVRIQVGDVLVREVAAPVVELYHLPERGLAAVVEEWPAQLHAAKPGRLERAVHIGPAITFRHCAERWVEGHFGELALHH